MEYQAREISRPKELLLVIVFLNSVCSGLVSPIVSSHVLKHKGTHLHSGLIGSAAVFCRLLLAEVVMTIFEQKHRRKKAILMHLLIAIMVYTLGILVTNVWIILLLICIFSLTNRTEVLCKKYIVKVCESLSPSELWTLIDIATVSGVIYGTVIGGYIYSSKNSFSCNATVAMVLTAINIGCLCLIEEDCDGDGGPDYLDSIKDTCRMKWDNLKHFNYLPHWDIIMLSTVYTGCMTIFFLKFPTLVKFRYKVGVIVANYTIAHHHMWIFASKHLVPYVKQNHVEYWSKIVFEECLVLCSVLFVGLLFAPSYECYLIISVPMILMRTLLDTLWNESSSDLASDNDLQDVCSTLNQIVVVLGHLIFGILAYTLGINISFLFLNLLPIAIVVYYVNRRYFKLKQD